MTPRERILTALGHEPPDRTPTDGWFHEEVMESLKRHYGTEDWEVVLGELGMFWWFTARINTLQPAPDQIDHFVRQRYGAIIKGNDTAQTRRPLHLREPSYL